jgi:hypothetical protein
MIISPWGGYLLPGIKTPAGAILPGSPNCKYVRYNMSKVSINVTMLIYIN